MLAPRRFARSLTLALVAGAVGAPMAAASGPVVYAPDARDANAAALRGQARQIPPRTDFRSPDTRDAAEGRAFLPAPPVQVVKVHSSSHGFDWGDAGIGAGGALALLLVGAGGLLAVSHRRGHPMRPSGPSALAG